MGYSVFSAGRDLLYLAAALLGTAAGLFSAAFFPSRTHSQRSRDITAAFYVVSAAVAAAGGALCVRQDLLFTAGVLPCAGVIALVFFAAFLFSAVLRFTLFIIISFMVISVVYFYRIGIGFDNVRAPIALVEYDGEDAVSIEGAYNPARIFSPGSAERQRATLFYDRRYTGMIKYALCFVTAGKAVPVFGGQKRVILLSVSVEQLEPGRTIQVFWTKPMEETLLGGLLRGNTELLNSASERVFRVSGRAFMEMQIIYGRAKIPAGKSGGASRLVLQNFYDHWRENWLDVESAD